MLKAATHGESDLEAGPAPRRTDVLHCTAKDLYPKGAGAWAATRPFRQKRVK